MDHVLAILPLPNSRIDPLLHCPQHLPQPQVLLPPQTTPRIQRLNRPSSRLLHLRRTHHQHSRLRHHLQSLRRVLPRSHLHRHHLDHLQNGIDPRWSLRLRLALGNLQLGPLLLRQKLPLLPPQQQRRQLRSHHTPLRHPPRHQSSLHLV